jgi:hypothetical protein
MEPEQFTALRESLGLSVFWLAHNARIKEADILMWEKGDRKVPKPAIKLLTQISDIIDEAEQKLFDIYIKPDNVSNKSRTVVLLRYICDEDLWTYQSDFAPLPVTTHNILLERINKRLASFGTKMITVYMLRDQYEHWRNKNNLDDDAAARAAWIVIQITDSDEDDLIEGNIIIAVY